MSGSTAAAEMATCGDCGSGWPCLLANSKPTCTSRTRFSISHIGTSSMDGVIRSSGAIHDFVIFLASGIAAK